MIRNLWRFARIPDAACAVPLDTLLAARQRSYDGAASGGRDVNDAERGPPGLAQAGVTVSRVWLTRQLRATLPVLVCGLALPAVASARTVVSLEFDHAFTDQLPAIAEAAHDGMKVTVFAMSGRIGETGYMSAAQLQRLQAQGDEIGGHTIDHPNLTQLPPAEQQHEVCGDRMALQALGLDATDFAYPFGAYNSTTEQIVAICGYASARTTQGIRSPAGCLSCPYAESIPPPDPYATRVPPPIKDTTSLATIEGYVTQAERNGGGWVQLVFHHICDLCNEYAITPSNFAALVAWLKPRAARGTVVEPIRQVISSAPPPVIPAGGWSQAAALALFALFAQQSGLVGW
jgi:hypothetical protein